MSGADRAINLALRVLGIGEVERDFKRVGDAGAKGFAQVEKSANGAAREVSDYTARLKRAAAEANRLVSSNPALNKGTRAEIRQNQRDFKLGFIGAEQDRINKGLPDLTRNLGAADAAAVGLGSSMGRMTALGTAAGAALAGLAVFTKDSLEAFDEHERTFAKFNAELALTGNRSDASAGQIEAMARRIVDATLQTEGAALKGAQSLATVSGMNAASMEAALVATARYADAVGKDLPDVVESTTRPVLQALADHDMAGLVKATEGLSDELRATILQLAETGKTAEAQKVFLEGLARAAGTGPGGTAAATNALGDAWRDLKVALGENIAGPAATGINWLRDQLKGLTGELEATRFSWSQWGKDVAATAWSPIGSAAIRGDRPFGRVARPAAEVDQRPDFVARAGISPYLVDAAAQKAAAATVKSFETRYGSGAKSGGGSGSASGAASRDARVGDMVAVIKQLFPTATVTSTTGGKHTKGSDHYAGRALDFVVPGMMNAAGTAEVERKLEAAGVDIRRNARGTKQLFGPGRPAEKPGDHDDHFHAAWKGSPDPERIASAGARDAERAREEAVRRARAFAAESAAVDGDLLRLKRGSLTDLGQLAEMDRAMVQLASDKYNEELRARVLLGELTKAQADELALKHAILAAGEVQQINLAERQQRAADELDLASAANDNQRDLLSAQEALALTAEDRRALALALLELDKREETARLKAVLASESASTLDKQKAAGRLEALPGIYGAREEGVRRQTAGPLEDYLRSSDPRGIQDRVDALVVGELEAVRGGINDAVNSALGIENPLLKGLVDIFIEQVLIRPIADALQQARQNSGGGGLGSLLSGALGLLGGGLSASGIAASNLTVGAAHAANPGIFALGTDDVPTGKPFWVGENGRELMQRERSGRISVLSNQQSHRAAGGAGGGTTIVQNISVPERSDARQTASGISRATFGALARSNRAGLATPPKWR